MGDDNPTFVKNHRPDDTPAVLDEATGRSIYNKLYGPDGVAQRTDGEGAISVAFWGTGGLRTVALDNVVKERTELQQDLAANRFIDPTAYHVASYYRDWVFRVNPTGSQVFRDLQQALVETRKAAVEKRDALADPLGDLAAVPLGLAVAEMKAITRFLRDTRALAR